MSVGYHINSEDGLISIQISGSPAAAELVDTAECILADDGFSSALPQLVDLRDWQGDGVSPEQFDNVRSYLLERYCTNVDASIAVVVNDDLSRQACASIYRLSAATGKAEMFENYDLAVRWLIRREFASRGAAQPAAYPA